MLHEEGYHDIQPESDAAVSEQDRPPLVQLSVDFGGLLNFCWPLAILASDAVVVHVEEVHKLKREGDEAEGTYEKNEGERIHSDAHVTAKA